MSIINKVFCEGTWSHKYDTAKNERIADAMDSVNDRTGYDAGMEPLQTNFDRE